MSNYLSRPGSTGVSPIGVRPSAPAPYRSARQTAPKAFNPNSGNNSALFNLLAANNAQQPVAPVSSTFTPPSNAYDPILSRIQALGSQSVANAQTNASQLRKEAGITAGDPELLRSLGFDQTTIDAASQNPTSLLASLNRDYSERQRALADQEQSQNLYYSGEYQRQLQNLSRGQVSALGDIGSQFRTTLSGVDAGVLAAEEKARQEALQAQLEQAQQQQFADWLTAMQSGYPPPDYGNPQDEWHLTPTTFRDIPSYGLADTPIGQFAPEAAPGTGPGGSMFDALANLTYNDWTKNAITAAPAPAPAIAPRRTSAPRIIRSRIS